MSKIPFGPTYEEMLHPEHPRSKSKKRGGKKLSKKMSSIQSIYSTLDGRMVVMEK